MAYSITNEKNNSLYKILNFRLPNGFKKVGIIGAILIFISLIAYKFIGGNTSIVKDILRTSILLFLLIASVSKDRFEDEYSRHIRFQSFVIAFIFAAAYYILIPLIAIMLDFVIIYFKGDGSVSFYENSAFEILFTMLGMQLLCYQGLKWFCREK